MKIEMKNKYMVLDKAALEQKYGRRTERVYAFDAGFPLLEIDDQVVEEIYYFRWSTFCRHLKETPVGYVVTEFLPEVPWAGIYNTISCAAGHHFSEGRWLHEHRYLKEYAAFWFTEGAKPRLYSFWAATAIYKACESWGDYSLAESLYESLKENYEQWEKEYLQECGLFYQVDDRDGMEFSIGGSGLRPTINSYMYGELQTLVKLAKRLGNEGEAEEFARKAERLRQLVNEKLWDEEAEFYKTLAEKRAYAFADVREEVGFIPWYYEIPKEHMNSAWKFLMDEKYFAAPYGPTTAERNHPDFMKVFSHECLWNGPSWPYATTQTLDSMAVLLRKYHQEYVSVKDYYALLQQYAGCHYLEENGVRRPFIDEDLDPFTGEWIARKILQSIQPERPDKNRGVDYNHSAFCDLVLSGAAGIEIKEGELTVWPLVDTGKVSYFCVDGVRYGDQYLTVIWDALGERYGKGKGLSVWVDGTEVAHTEQMGKMVLRLGNLPECQEKEER